MLQQDWKGTFACLHICLSAFLSFNFSVCLFFSLSVCTSTCLSDLHFGFLPDDCDEEFNNCFNRIGKVHVPVCTSVYLFICLSIYIFYPSIFLFVFFTVCVSDLHFGFFPYDCEDEFNECFNRIGKVHLPACTSVCLHFYLSIFLFVFFSVCLSVPPPVCLIFILDLCRIIVTTSYQLLQQYWKGMFNPSRFIYLFIYLSIFPLVVLTVYLTVSPPVCLILISDICWTIVRMSLSIALTRLERSICLSVFQSICLAVCVFVC
jgi:hypothetical protein